MFDAVGKEEYANRVLQKLHPKFFTQQDLKTALWFLQGYCCENIAANTSCPESLKHQTKYYPESPYLFDHLIYVWMSKLDWYKAHCDTLQITCDEQALTWRDKIIKIAESRQWVAPSEILLTFSDLWWSKTDAYLSSWSQTISARYHVMCEEAQSIFSNIWLTQSSQASLDDGSPNGRLASRSDRCKALIQERYLTELHYIQTLQVEKGMKFYIDNINSYINTYFFQNRWMSLLDVVQEMNSCFTPVLHTVERTENCCVSGKE